jgi:hypothetical protein
MDATQSNSELAVPLAEKGTVAVQVQMEVQVQVRVKSARHCALLPGAGA